MERTVTTRRAYVGPRTAAENADPDTAARLVVRDILRAVIAELMGPDVMLLRARPEVTIDVALPVAVGSRVLRLLADLKKPGARIRYDVRCASADGQANLALQVVAGWSL